MSFDTWIQLFSHHHNEDTEKLCHSKEFPYLQSQSPPHYPLPTAAPINLISFFIVLPFPEGHRNWNTSYLISVSDCFHLTKCSQGLLALLQGSVVVAFYYWVVSHCMDSPQFVYPLISWQTFRLFWIWGYCERICYKHFHGGLEVHLCFISSGSGVDMNSFMLNFLFLFIYFFLFGCTASSLQCVGLLFCRAQASVVANSGSVVGTHRLSCSTVCGIFPDQGSNPRPLYWQMNSHPLPTRKALCLTFKVITELFSE